MRAHRLMAALAESDVKLDISMRAQRAGGNSISRAMHFYAGQRSLKADFQPWMLKEVKLPYEYTCIEFELDADCGYFFALCEQMKEGVGIIGLWLLDGLLRRGFNKDRLCLPIGMTVVGPNGEIVTSQDYSSIDPLPKFFPKQTVSFSEIAELAGLFLSVLNCSNIEYIDNPAPENLNRKRIAAGKVPLFSYKTLHVKTDAREVNRNPMGGTHASPRVHLRRGHVRRLSETRNTWVSACVVGNRERGMVHKEYAVTA